MGVPVPVAAIYVSVEVVYVSEAAIYVPAAVAGVCVLVTHDSM